MGILAELMHGRTLCDEAIKVFCILVNMSWWAGGLVEWRMLLADWWTDELACVTGGLADWRC